MTQTPSTPRTPGEGDEPDEWETTDPSHTVWDDEEQAREELADLDEV